MRLKERAYIGIRARCRRDEARARCGSGGERAMGGAAKPHAGKSSAESRGEGIRTSNIKFMLVTLDVSRVSGWLKAPVRCRVARWVYEARGRCVPGGERAVGGCDGASGIQGRALGWRSG